MDYLFPCLNTRSSIWRNHSRRCSFWWRITRQPTHSMRTLCRKSQSYNALSFPENALQMLRDKLGLCYHTMIKSDLERKGFLSSYRLQFIIQGHWGMNLRWEPEAEVTEKHCFLACFQAHARHLFFPLKDHCLVIHDWIASRILKVLNLLLVRLFYIYIYWISAVYYAKGTELLLLFHQCPSPYYKKVHSAELAPLIFLLIIRHRSPMCSST